MKQIKEIRKKYEEKSSSNYDGQLIYIEPNLLDKLLFHTDNYGNKFLIWNGDFLSKIDLSEINFDDVIWNINYTEQYRGNPLFKTNELENVYKLNDVTQINLSNTNAKIKFNLKFNDLTNLYNCNFSGVDLSESNFGYINKAYNCNFSSCNLKIHGEIINVYKNCDFSYNDFSKNFINLAKKFSLIKDNIFLHTNVNILYNLENYLCQYSNYFEYKEIVNDITRLIENNCFDENYETLISIFFPYIEDGKQLGNFIKNDLIMGCRVNGKRIYTKEEKIEIKVELNEYFKRHKKK